MNFEFSRVCSVILSSGHRVLIASFPLHLPALLSSCLPGKPLPSRGPIPPDANVKPTWTHPDIHVSDFQPALHSTTAKQPDANQPVLNCSCCSPSNRRPFDPFQVLGSVYLLSATLEVAVVDLPPNPLPPGRLGLDCTQSTTPTPIVGILRSSNSTRLHPRKTHCETSFSLTCASPVSGIFQNSSRHHRRPWSTRHALFPMKPSSLLG